ncbi:DNA methyltransferase [Leisingera aquaemixtae]|uniref:Methyltransferase n=1 Tax=Leisingera aquaemixtae TaxID=1396826 RepID=A0A0N7M5A4_9RHOB|nr:DNA methyltransferase [Leisingera aquaemixtae]CUI01882.1 DNA adenine methyltransferase YhdJ [Leisingera aquaemixtae]
MTKEQIICGDAVAGLLELQSECVDLIVTDPPYLVDYKDRTGRKVANDNSPDAVLPAFAEMYRVLKDDSLCISFVGWTALDKFTRTWVEAGFRIVGHIIWTKDYASSTGQTAYHHESAYVLAKGWPRRPETPFADVQPWVYSGNRWHPTEKSVENIGAVIRAFSKRDDTVLDPFLGSGTTAVAAALNGRSAIGIELERRYCDLAQRRVAGDKRYLATKDQSASKAA